MVLQNFFPKKSTKENVSPRSKSWHKSVLQWFDFHKTRKTPQLVNFIIYDRLSCTSVVLHDTHFCQIWQTCIEVDFYSLLLYVLIILWSTHNLASTGNIQ